MTTANSVVPSRGTRVRPVRVYVLECTFSTISSDALADALVVSPCPCSPECPTPSSRTLVRGSSARSARIRAVGPLIAPTAIISTLSLRGVVSVGRRVALINARALPAAVRRYVATRDVHRDTPGRTERASSCAPRLSSLTKFARARSRRS